METDLTTYRVTKYDPVFRDKQGAYVGITWTGVSDIGKYFNGRLLTASEYLGVEGRYVRSVDLFMFAANIKTLYVTQLAGYRHSGFRGVLEDANSALQIAMDQSVVSGKELGDVVRACLREGTWCRLIGENGFHVHFGNDYYMYVGLPAAFQPPSNLPDDMFVEVLENCPCCEE